MVSSSSGRSFTRPIVPKTGALGSKGEARCATSALAEREDGAVVADDDEAAIAGGRDADGHAADALAGEGHRPVGVHHADAAAEARERDAPGGVDDERRARLGLDLPEEGRARRGARWRDDGRELLLDERVEALVADG